MNKVDVDTEAIIPSNQTKGEINNMEKIYTLFQGLSRAKVKPFHIETDRTVKQIQQKQPLIALQYKTLFRQHIEELQKEGVVSPPMDSSHAIWSWFPHTFEPNNK